MSQSSLKTAFIIKGQISRNFKHTYMSGFQQVVRMLIDDHFVENPFKKIQSYRKLWLLIYDTYLFPMRVASLDCVLTKTHNAIFCDVIMELKF